MLTQILTLLLLLVLSGFFSGTETALMSLTMAKVNALVNKNKKGAPALQRLKQNPHRLLITILIGNNLVNIGAAAMATVLFTDLLGSSGIGIATGVMTFLVLVFGEITPKTYATQNAERISLFVARPVELLAKIIAPFVKLFEAISRLMAKLLGTKEEQIITADELRSIVAMGRSEGILSKEAAEMMHNVMRFEGITAAEIMTPDVDIEMCDGEAKLEDLLDFIVKSPYSRYPVFFGNRDTIIGIIDVDDILRQVKNNDIKIKIKTIAKPVNFVPETKEIDDLLTELENDQIPMVIVVDEYGHVSGLITVDDILEEIVGDIFDKSKKPSAFVNKISSRIYRVDAKATLVEINSVFGLQLKNNNVSTLAGYIEQQLQRVPRKGEQLKLKKVTIEVDRVTKQGIKSVRIIKTPLT